LALAVFDLLDAQQGWAEEGGESAHGRAIFGRPHGGSITADALSGSG
jgi:hypothetical protein